MDLKTGDGYGSSNRARFHRVTSWNYKKLPYTFQPAEEQWKIQPAFCIRITMPHGEKPTSSWVSITAARRQAGRKHSGMVPKVAMEARKTGIKRLRGLVYRADKSFR